MSKAGFYFRVGFGFFLLIGGIGIVTADIAVTYRNYLSPAGKFDPHWLHILFGTLVGLIGGWLMAPALVEKLVAFLDERFGKYIPTRWVGGRRSTDIPVIRDTPSDEPR